MRYAILALTLTGLVTAPVFQAAALTANDAVAIWLMEDGSGTAVADASSNGNNGAVATGGTWTAGKFGGGLHLDGTAGVVSPTAAGFNKSTISQTMWVQFDALQNEAQFGFVTAGLSGVTDRLYYFSTWCAAGAPHRCVHLGTVNVDGTWGRGIAAPTVFNVGEWVHVAGVVNNTTGVTTAYVNGQEFFTQQFALGDPPINATGLIAGRTTGGNPVIGTIDEVAYFKTALTQADVQNVMNNGVMVAIGAATAVEAQGKVAVTWANLKK